MAYSYKLGITYKDKAQHLFMIYSWAYYCDIICTYIHRSISWALQYSIIGKIKHNRPDPTYSGLNTLQMLQTAMDMHKRHANEPHWIIAIVPKVCIHNYVHWSVSHRLTVLALLVCTHWSTKTSNLLAINQNILSAKTIPI